MNITSVTVWYNPSEKEVVNILTYSKKFKKVYIIDNSNIDNSELSSKIKNAEYIPLMENTGIAYALNRGFEKAISDGYDWIMTMDQDSSWNEDELDKYLLWTEDVVSKDSKIASLAPTHYLKHTSLLGKLFFQTVGRLLAKTTKPETEYVDRVICSANIVSVNVWKELGGFNERLFIDEVDFEFCYRLRIKNYLIIINNCITYNHILGNEKLTLFPKFNRHSSMRLYYIYRNSMYIMEKYPDFAEKFAYKQNLAQLIRHTCILSFNCFSNRKILQKSKNDLKKIL